MNGLFYLVVRCFIKNGNETHSVELKQTFEEAEARFYGIVAADIANNEIEYMSAYVIRGNDGTMEMAKVKDRRAAEVEE